jgi:hypothetical protein
MVHGPWCSTFDGVSALLFDVLPITIGASDVAILFRTHGDTETTQQTRCVR